MAWMVPSRLACPVSTTRVVFGCSTRTRAKNSVPFMSGMSMSDTTTSTGDSASIASASRAEFAASTS